MTATSPTTATSARHVLARRQRARRRIRLVLWLIAAVLMADAIVGDRGLVALRRARNDHVDLIASITRLRRENRALGETARQLREDPHTIEELARRELGLSKRGELLFIIKDIENEHR